MRARGRLNELAHLACAMKKSPFGLFFYLDVRGLECPALLSTSWRPDTAPDSSGDQAEEGGRVAYSVWCRESADDDSINCCKNWSWG
jgi:hypothetical protein